LNYKFISDFVLHIFTGIMGINFNALPVKEMILLLRRLGMYLLEELLGEQGVAGKELSEEPQPELWKLLTYREIKTLAQAQVWKVKWNWKTGLIPANMRDDLRRALKKLIPKTIDGKIKSRQWEVGICNRLALALGGTAGNILPDELWLAAAGAAWCDPNFQFSVAMKLINWLRNTRLMVPYEHPEPRLSPNTFWVLIALTQIKPLEAGYFFSPKERAAVRVQRRFQEEANLRIMVNEWAGFWDQWVIRLASQRWPSGFRQMDTRLCKALLALPLLDTTAMPKLCRSKTSLMLSIRLFIEKWFAKIDGIRRLRRSTQSRRRQALLNLTAPGWENHMPDFFTAVENRGEREETRRKANTNENN
jgi:hypothetical protein